MLSDAIFLKEYTVSQELVNDGDVPLNGELVLYLETIGPNSDIQEGMKKKLISEIESLVEDYNMNEYNNRGR